MSIFARLLNFSLAQNVGFNFFDRKSGCGIVNNKMVFEVMKNLY